MKYLRVKNGFSALVAVLITGAAVLTLTLNTAFSGLQDLDIDYYEREATSGFYLAEACAAEGLRRLRLDPEFSVVALELVLDSGTCLLDVSDAGGLKRIEASSLGRFERKISLTTGLTGDRLEISGWQEN